jgi:hypothetical protein
MKIMKPFFIFAALLLLVSCEEKEKPVRFGIGSETNYSFPAATDAAAFYITSNIPWQATLINGGDWCSVTPASAGGDETVIISVTENTAYMQERTAGIVVTAGAFRKAITVTQAPPPCPGFSAGAIASTGQTVVTGDTPATINSLQPASGVGAVSYQWYKNGIAINNATAESYTPPATDAAEAGTYTYTRRAKDDVCSTTLTQSEGSWSSQSLPVTLMQVLLLLPGKPFAAAMR